MFKNNAQSYRVIVWSKESLEFRNEQFWQMCVERSHWLSRQFLKPLEKAIKGKMKPPRRRETLVYSSQMICRYYWARPSDFHFLHIRATFFSLVSRRKTRLQVTRIWKFVLKLRPLFCSSWTNWSLAIQSKMSLNLV